MPEYVKVLPRMPEELLTSFLSRIESLHPLDVGEILKKIVTVIYELRCMLPESSPTKAREEIMNILQEMLSVIAKQKEGIN